MMKLKYSGKKKQLAGAMLLTLTLFCSCSEEVADEAFYTFTGNTVASFCQKSDSLSIFYHLIDESGNTSLLSTYGHFTCFAPTNAAFALYFQEKGIRYEDLDKDAKQNILYNHLISDPSSEFLSTAFQEGALPTVNLNDRFLVISLSVDENQNMTYLVNHNSLIIMPKDNEVHNGVVHIVDKVIEPSLNDLAFVIRENGAFTLFSQALELTHLADSIQGAYDYTYQDPLPGADFKNVRTYDCMVMHRKKLGYTLFAEPDEVFRAKGIQSLDDLLELAKRYYGTADLNDYTSRDNPLNKFVSYHLLDRQMPTNALIYSGPMTSSDAMDKRYEYYETMLKMRLMEIKAGNKINTLKDGSYIGVDESKSNMDGMNGYAHALTGILLYDEDLMQNDVLNKRLRFDAYAIPPQITNNNLRWKLSMQSGRDKATFPPEYCGEHFTFNPATDLILWAADYWNNLQEDEMSIRGWYDFTFRLPPVPPGSWEIRLGYIARSWGGVAQIFIDDQIVGIPVNFNMEGNDPVIGWVLDADTPDGGIENDKMMRNRGYMKGVSSIVNTGGTTNRNNRGALRKIIGTYTWQDYDYHYFRAKNLESADGEFHLDYFEYVPTSYLDEEGID
jgi:uncharacterized surface protein with fasciclin (FAS1) repeats